VARSYPSWIPLFIVCLLLAPCLSGCVKGQASIVVEPDGSGAIGLALGMTSQARAMLSTSGEDPLNEMSAAMQGSSEGEEVSVRQWTEGEYEWTEATRRFEDPDELNELMNETEFFDDFTLSRVAGFPKNRFVLDGTLQSDTMESPSADVDFDPSGFFQFDLTVTLPGEITETNGIYVGDAANKVSWPLLAGGTRVVRATSEVWNWPILIAAGLCLLITSSGAAGLALARMRGAHRRSLALPASPPTRLPGVASTDATAEEGLLPLEMQAAELFQCLGHRTVGALSRTRNSTDLLIRSSTGQKWIVRCISGDLLREGDVGNFVTMVRREAPEEAALIGGGACTPGARAMAEQARINLLDGRQFLAYLEQARRRSAVLPAKAP